MKKQLSDKNSIFVVILVAILVIFGAVMIYSASYYVSISSSGNPNAYLKKHLIWVVLGTCAMIICAKVDYHIWNRFWIVAYIVGLGLLVAVLTGLGSSAYGATRWISVGPITLMPGEIAKACLIIFIAGFYSRNPKSGDKFRSNLFIIILAGIYAGLIMLQPNFSTAATVCFIAGGMLIIAGIKWRYVAGLIGFAAAAFYGFVVLDDGYRHERFLSFLDPFQDALNTGYNVVQSLYALGSGGLFGVGLGNSVEKNLYLPMPQNDFILAIIGEELGFVGILILLIVYALLVFVGLKIAMDATDYTGMMLAAGTTIMLGLQVIINVAVVTSSMPPTGVVLPFVSYGGNALLIFMAGMGIIVNVSKQTNRERILEAGLQENNR